MTDAKKCILDALVRHRKKGSSVEIDTLDPDASLIEEGVLDSMSFVSLIIDLEDLMKSDVGLGDIDPHEHTSINGLVRFFSGQ